MRIAVATDDGISIAEHFGRCAGFEIFDVSEKETIKIGHRPNAAGHHHQDKADCSKERHHEGSHNHESFVRLLQDCNVVICRGMGRRAEADLTANGIRPVKSSQDIPVAEAVRLFAAGRLDESDNSPCCSH